MSLNYFKNRMHALFNGFGFEVRLLKNLGKDAADKRAEMERQKWRVLANFDIKTVLDIGANEGQFARQMRSELPACTIYSFEPLPDVFRVLASNFADDSMVVPVQLALGDRDGVEAMHRSEFSPSSSLLPMSQLHKSEWPHTALHTRVEIQLTTLDSWALKLDRDVSDGLLIKMDVQGYELAVIKGGTETLQLACLLIVEVSYHALYEGQPLFAEIHENLRALGFIYRGNIEQYYSDKSDQILFADAVFENTRNHANA